MTGVAVPITGSVSVTYTTQGRPSPPMARQVSIVAYFRASRPICQQGPPPVTLVQPAGTYCEFPLYVATPAKDAAGNVAAGTSVRWTDMGAALGFVAPHGARILMNNIDTSSVGVIASDLGAGPDAYAVLVENDTRIIGGSGTKPCEGGEVVASSPMIQCPTAG